MQKSSLYCIIGLSVLLIAGGVYSCKKVNGINNNNVVATPFSLYFSDTSGTLFNSIDGQNISQLVFPADGFPCRAICTDSGNILWAKGISLFISTDNGKNFNYSNDSLMLRPDVACNNLPLTLNQTMILDIPSWQRVYVTDSSFGNSIRHDTLGLAHNDSFGLAGYWVLDTVYNYDSVGALPVEMTSLTQLANGTLCGLALDPAAPGYVRNFYKTCKDDASCSWMENTANPGGAVPSIFQYNTTGTPLPTLGYFVLGHFNNRLIAIDSKCANGAWYSDDVGRNWKQFQGLPNVPLLCIASPFGQNCLIGTDSAGLYMLNLNTGVWEPNDNGLGKYLVVRSITFKENIYKNNTTQQYVYIATNQGIYQSTDGGHNWIQTIHGNYVAIY